MQATLRLADEFGDRRLELACARALYYGETSPQALKRILENGLENGPLPLPPAPAPGQTYLFARPGSEIFPCQGGHGHG